MMPALRLPFRKGYLYSYRQLFSKEEGDALSYFYVMVESAKYGTNSTLHVYMLQNGDHIWRTHLTLALDYLIAALSSPKSVLVDNKVYIASSRNEILVLDLMSPGFSTIQLPPGVDFNIQRTTMLSHAHDDDSSVYLIHAKDLQLHIWLYRGANWLLVDTICLREMCAHYLQDEPTAFLKINHVGDYTAEFLFLEMDGFALYLDVKCRTLRKLYFITREDRYFYPIYPFTMIWPPIFPALKDAPARFASLPVHLTVLCFV